ncbi:MAG: hypothetical protein PHH77_10950 [Victivallaceae bacterium]|nr:hypothetical protein [Victivallaceae bacterium]
MTNFEKEVITRLTRMEAKLDNDYRELHGHEGKPGLIDKHDALDDRVHTIETTYKTWGTVLGLIVAIFSIASAIVAVAAFLNKEPKQKEKNHEKPAFTYRAGVADRNSGGRLCN